MKRFLEFFVKKSSFTIILFVALLALGFNALLTMPRGEDPEVSFPTYTIVAVYPGATPSDIEDQVLTPIEDRLNELENIKQVKSTAEDGLAIIRVEYDFGVNVDDKYQEIIREINAMRNKLPENLYSLEVKQYESSDVNIYQLALVSSSASYKELEYFAGKLDDELKTLPDLKKVEKWGYPQREIRVSLNLEKLAQNGIPLNNVLRALQSENLNIPGGFVNAGLRKFNVKTNGEYQTLDDVRNTVVYTSGQKIVPLRDIAEVGYGYEQEQHLTRLNGIKCVLVTACQKPGRNIFGIASQADPLIAGFASSLPPHIRLVKNFDQAESVSSRLSRLGKDFLLAMLLVSITLSPLGWRAAVVVMISIPLSLAVGLFLLEKFGFTINQLSIVGLIVALGILVDDAIVIIENIERFLRSGMSKGQAVIESTRQIALAVIGVTATLIIAFMPLLNLPGAPGAFIKGLPMAVVCAVSASLFVSLTIVPFLSHGILKSHHQPEGNIFLRALKKGIDLSYSRLMRWSLRHPARALMITGGIVLVSLAVVPRMGFSLFPRSEKPQFAIDIELPNSASLEETDLVSRDVEKVLGANPEITYYTANIGKGNPMVYYNVPQHGQQSNFAEIFVQCKAENWEEKNALIQRLRRQFQMYPKGKIHVLDYEQGPPLEAPVAIRVFGDNLDTLRSLSLEVEDTVQSVPGVRDISNSVATQVTDLKVNINKEKAGMVGVSVADIEQTVHMAIAGVKVAEIPNDLGGDKLPINVTLARARFPTTSVFNRIYVNSMTGKALPLYQVADVKMDVSPTMISHLDKRRYASVNAFAQSGYVYNALNSSVITKLNGLKFPTGYHWEAAGELESQQRSFEGFGTIIMLTVFAFIAALLLEFGSFKSASIVLSVIPLGAIGGILALFITGNTFSFTALIGFIALTGIEIKNSILLVDHTNQLREQGMPLDEAIEKSGETRFVPILLTTLTAIGGMIPLILEPAPLYTPLAIVLVGGLTSSLLLSRIVTPVLYKMLAPKL